MPQPRNGALTWYQDGLWFSRYWLAPGSAYEGICDLWYLPGRPDAGAVRAAFARLADRHETLRTAFWEDSEGNAVQTVQPSLSVRLPVVEAPLERLRTDLNELTGTFTRPDSTSTHDLRWRAVLGVKDRRVYAVAVTADLMLTDGAGLLVLRDELFRELAQRDSTSRVVHPLDQVTYENSSAAVAAAGDNLIALEKILSAAPQSTFPWQHGDAAGPAAYLAAELRSAELLKAVDRLCRTYRASRPTVVLAVVCAVLAMWTGHPRSLVRTVSSNRVRENHGTDIQGRFQWAFVVNDLADDLMFRDVVERTRDATVQALQCTGIAPNQLRELLARLSAERGVHLEQSLAFDYLPGRSMYPRSGAQAPVDESRLRNEKIGYGRTPERIPGYCLFTVSVEGDELVVVLDSDVRILAPARSRDILGWLAATTARVVGRPDTKLGELRRAVGITCRERPRRSAVVDGCLVDLDRLAGVISDCPGVATAAVHLTEPEGTDASGLVAYVVPDRERLAPFDVHEHVLDSLVHEAGVIAPHRYTLCLRAPASDESALWACQPVLASGTGRELPWLSPGSEKDRALVEAVRYANGIDVVNMANTYVQAGGRMAAVPQVVGLLARSGYTGLTATDVRGPVTLRRIASRLRDTVTPGAAG